MSKLFFIIFFKITLSAYAQLWCFPGAEWHYSRSYLTGNGYAKHTYVGNELFQSKNCEKLLYYSEEYNYLSQAVQTYSSSYYTYMENSIVYVYNVNQQEFDTLINYAAIPGDVWYYPNYSPVDCYNVRCLVADTGHHIIEGQNLKWLKINGVYANDTIYERIGNLYQYSYHQTNNCPALDIAYGGPLRCYKDNQIQNFKKYANSCNYFNIPNNLKKKNFENSMSFYPNPVLEVINIEFTEESELSQIKEIIVSDIFGNKVKKVIMESKKQKVNLEELSKGVYYLQLQSIDGLKIIKKLVKE